MIAGSWVKFSFCAFLSFAVKAVKFDALKFASSCCVLAVSATGACLAKTLAEKTAKNKNKIFLIVVL